MVVRDPDQGFDEQFSPRDISSNETLVGAPWFATIEVIVATLRTGSLEAARLTRKYAKPPGRSSKSPA